MSEPNKKLDHSPLPWQLIETRYPYTLATTGQEGYHTERRIFTLKDDPQLKAPWPIVTGSVAIGNHLNKAYHLVSISERDALFIIDACNNYERVKAELEALKK